MSSTVELVPDAWLSGQLERPAYRLKVAAGCSLDEVSRALGRINSPAFVDAKVPGADAGLASMLVRQGFVLVDTAVTFALAEDARPDGSVSTAVRAARPDDRDAVAAVARGAFRYSRFHVDPDVDNAVADALKAEWAASYFRGERGDEMIVAEVDGSVIGFLQLLVGERLTIDLIGVAPGARRRGLAREMISFALEKVRPAGAVTVVGTQVANVPSVRLYEGLGFRFIGAHHVLHLHR